MQPPKEQLDKAKQIWDIANTGALTFKQGKQLVDTLIGAVKSAKDRFESTAKELKRFVDRAVSGVEDSVSELGRRLDATAKDLSSQMKEARKEAKSDMDALAEELRGEIEGIEAGVEERALLADVEARLAELKGMVPDLPLMQRKLDELMDKCMKEMSAFKEEQAAAQRAANGVSNLRVQQAFKHILKTEQPSGTIDGSNAEFTVTQDIFAVLSMSLNGETIAQLPNYTVRGRKIVFSSPIPAAYSGKDFEIRYV